LGQANSSPSFFGPLNEELSHVWRIKMERC